MERRIRKEGGGPLARGNGMCECGVCMRDVRAPEEKVCDGGDGHGVASGRSRCGFDVLDQGGDKEVGEGIFA